MGAKYNKLMDSFTIRIAINIAVFGAWLAVSYALLKL